MDVMDGIHPIIPGLCNRAAHGYPEKRPRSRAPGDASGASGLVWDLHLQCKHIYPNLSVYLSICLSVHLSICPSVHLFIHLSIHPSIRHLSMYLFIEGSLEVKLPTIWTDEKQSRAEAERRGRLEERRSEEKESGRKKMQMREKVGKSRNTVFFQ